MDRKTALHVSSWIKTSRENLTVILENITSEPKEEQVRVVREQYSVLSTLKKVFNRDAYFVGTHNKHTFRKT